MTPIQHVQLKATSHSCSILSEAFATILNGPQSHIWRGDFRSAATYLQACFYPLSSPYFPMKEADGSHGRSWDDKGNPRMHFFSEQIHSCVRMHESSFMEGVAGSGRDLM